MSELKICLICLRTEAKLYHFNQYLLKNYYEELMAFQLEDMESLPRYFCYECAALLHKFHKFKEKCCIGQQIFKEMLWKGQITYELVNKIDCKSKMLESSLTTVKDISCVNIHIIKDSKEYVSDIENNVTKVEPDSLSETSNNVDHLSDDECDVNNDIKIKMSDKEDKCPLANKDKFINDKEKIKVRKKKILKRKIKNDKSNLMITENHKAFCGKIETDDVVKKLIDIVIEETTPSEKSKTELNKDDEVSSPTTVCVESENILDESENVNNTSKSIKTRSKSVKTTSKSVKTTSKSVKTTSKSVKTDNVKKAIALQNTKNWKITRLSEEDALKEFKAKGESKKYLAAAFKCGDCFKGFSKKEMLERHVQLSHIEQLGKFACHFCGYRYKHDCYRTRHIKQHYYRYKCLRCDLICYLATTAMIHEECHSGVIRKCKHCNEEFKHSSTYYTHLRTHRSEHVCTICGASFVSSLGLHQHKIKKHVITEIESPDDDEDVNTYCQRCDIRFETRKAYEEHLFHSALHNDDDAQKAEKLASESNETSEKVSPHKKILGKREKTKITKELHKRKNDEDVDVYMPRKRYRRRDRRQRNKPTTCYQCGMHFETQAACLKHHSQAHPRTSFCPPSQRYICEICGSSLAPGSITTHQNIHTREKMHTCDTCGKQFHSNIGLRRHLVCHTGEKPFACPLCDKRFTQSNSMKLHYKTFHLKQPYPKRNRQRKTETKQSGVDNSGSDSSSDESLHGSRLPRRSGIEPVVQRAEDTIHYFTLT